MSLPKIASTERIASKIETAVAQLRIEPIELRHEFASSGFYSSRPCLLEVKDESGPLFSMPFRETAR
jgi:hypothetical protein